MKKSSRSWRSLSQQSTTDPLSAGIAFGNRADTIGGRRHQLTGSGNQVLLFASPDVADAHNGKKQDLTPLAKHLVQMFPASQRFY